MLLEEALAGSSSEKSISSLAAGELSAMSAWSWEEESPGAPEADGGGGGQDRDSLPADGLPDCC